MKVPDRDPKDEFLPKEKDPLSEVSRVFTEPPYFDLHTASGLVLFRPESHRCPSKRSGHSLPGLLGLGGRLLQG